MNETAFDALDATGTLERAGFDERQARVVAGVVREAVDADRDTLATKADIAAVDARLVTLDARFVALEARLVALEARLKAEIDTGLAGLRADNADLRAYIDKLETRFTVRLFGGLFAVTGLNVAAMAALKLFA